MKRIFAPAAVLLFGLCACQPAAGGDDAAALMAMIAAASEDLPPVSEPAPIRWDGEYADGARSFTLSLGEDGTLVYETSDGSAGQITDVTGTAAKTGELHFSLCEDTLSVFGGGYTGNYERK